MTYQLPDLPYAYYALEPFIDKETMQIHHDKHHATYVEKLNASIEECNGCSDKSIEELLLSIHQIPEHVRQAVINNGGGHANHSLYWIIMGANGKKQPEGKLADDIKTTFGSFDQFKAELTAQAISRFGSGWAWLNVSEKGQLHIETTINQDSPLLKGHKPLLCLDVWEHAYYLKYKNKRADYIEAWWNVVNWNKVEELYNQFKK